MNLDSSISLIDDEISWHHIIKDLFSGYRIREFSFFNSILSFKSWLERHPPPDLAIIDIFMQNQEDGFELLKWIKKRFKQTKSIILTGRSKDVLKAMSLHSDGFLTKSELTHLPKAVNEVLNHRRYLSDKGWEYIVRQFNEYGGLFDELFNSNLTQKEKEVIRAYIHTKFRKGVAAMTGIKEETVKRHHNSILKKLCLTRMNEVAKKFGRFF